VFRATGEGDGDYTNRRSIEAMAGCGVDYVGSLRKGSAEKDNTGTTEETEPMIAFRQKMATPEAQKQYRRRSRVIEFCHAWIKSKLGLRQFHLRGLAKVQMEMLWACLTYNLQQWIRLRKLSPALLPLKPTAAKPKSQREFPQQI